MRALVAEDNTDFLDVTLYALRKYGFEADAVTDGAAALERWKTGRYDIALLDIRMPGMSGLEVCREIRKDSSAPIIMVTALSDDDEVVEGFDCGANDYVTKPVSYRVLAARMHNLLERQAGREMVRSTTTAQFGDITVDLETHEVHKSGELIRMTRLETRILYFLGSNAGRVLPTDRLIELVWEYDGGDAFTLKTHISHIRQKLGINKGEPGYISSAPHIGYRLETASKPVVGPASLAAA